MTEDRDIPVIDTTEGKVSLYSKRETIHPRSIQGRFQRLRDLTVWLTMGGYMLGPWLRWDGSQAILFDIPARQFQIFGITFWPQDFFLLAMLLMLLAFSLFFFTVLAGRVYCGYVCPQTTWTRFFTWIEEITEGSRNKRFKLDDAPWSFNKITRRGSKHALWLLLALATGVTFVGYFTPILELIPRLFSFELGRWEMIWIGFFTGATYLNAGWMREQVCIYMCPYARFQSVMFDRDTMIVSYDEGRGEPRGRGIKNRDEKGLGDCIDCELCVQVCPTGIDIRDGLQFECITCAACIDACDQVMDQVDKPRGLIRYTTENALENKPTKLARPRLLGYGAVLAVMLLVFSSALLTRVPVGLDVMRDRGQLYRTASTGQIENVYRLAVMNMSQDGYWFELRLDGPEGLNMRAPERIFIDGGERANVPVTLGYDPLDYEIDTQPVWFIVEAEENARLHARRESRFIAPR